MYSNRTRICNYAIDPPRVMNQWRELLRSQEVNCNYRTDRLPNKLFFRVLCEMKRRRQPAFVNTLLG